MVWALSALLSVRLTRSKTETTADSRQQTRSGLFFSPEDTEKRLTEVVQLVVVVAVVESLARPLNVSPLILTVLAVWLWLVLLFADFARSYA